MGPQEHIDMLLGDPSFAEQFDEVYGVGRSQYYLTQNAMLNSVPADVSSEATPVSSMLSAPAMPRDSFGYDYSQGDSDEDIISTTSYPVMSQQQAVAMPPQQPKVVDDYDFFPADNSPSVPMAPVQTTLSPQQGL